MKVSVNILCFNTFRTLTKSIDVLRKELYFTSHEIIVIDNGSTDELKSYVSTYEDVRIIRNEKNEGISKGKNQGIRASSGEFIFLLDGDVIPVPNSVLMLIDWLEQNEDKVAIGFLPNKFSMEMNREGYTAHESYCHTLFNPRKHCAACLFYGLYRRTMFEKVMMDESGPFGEEGYGWEDHDFFRTMEKNGYEQWVAGLNTETGKYYHLINSYTRAVGYDKYTATLKKRSAYYNEKWNDPKAQEFIEKCLPK